MEQLKKAAGLIKSKEAYEQVVKGIKQMTKGQCESIRLMNDYGLNLLITDQEAVGLVLNILNEHYSDRLRNVNELIKLSNKALERVLEEHGTDTKEV